MLSFLNPWAFMGLLLLAIPIAIHIFKPRKTRRTLFTNLRWLKESKHRISRRIQWHQIVLFLFRAALVILLVLTLARPLLNLVRSDKVREQFIVLDTSRTMDYGEDKKDTPFESARRIATSLLNVPDSRSRYALLFASKSSKAVGPLALDTQKDLAALQAVKVSKQDGDLVSVLPIIRSMLDSSKETAEVEITFLTNNLQKAWTQDAILEFLAGMGTKDLKVKVIDVAPTHMQNAWIADASVVVASDHIPGKIKANIGWAGDGETERVVHLKGFANLPDLSTQVKLNPGRLATMEVELPEEYREKSGTIQLELEPHDALADDDVFLINLKATSRLKILVVESLTTRVTALQAGLHLRTGLEALSKIQEEAFEVISRSPDKLSEDEVKAADLIILVEPNDLSMENLTRIKNRVRLGAGLAIFLGPAVNVAYFNERFHHAEGSEMTLVPFTLENVVAARQGQSFPLTDIHWDHPLLANLFDPEYGDLPQTRIFNYFNLDYSPEANRFRVLAKIGGSTPAITESDYGSGKVIVFNLTANDQWSDLPRRPSFVPLLDRLVNDLAGGLVRREFRVGETMTIPIGSFDESPEVTVKAPDGNTLHPRLKRVAGQFVVQLESVTNPGVYELQITGSPDPIKFIVQSARADSSLDRMDPETLKKWWDPVSVEWVTINEDSGNEEAKIAQLRSQFPLWSLLAGLACFAFLGEMMLTHWLCPKVTPILSKSRMTYQQPDQVEKEEDEA